MTSANPNPGPVDAGDINLNLEGQNPAPVPQAAGITPPAKTEPKKDAPPAGDKKEQMKALAKEHITY